MELHPSVETQPTSRGEGFLNIGICLDGFALDYTPTIEDVSVQIELETREGGDQLIHFAIRLFKLLQTFGSVPAVDMAMYEAQVFATPPSD